MDFRLDQQVAIITGAGRGLGRAHALALAGRGARVLVNDLDDAGPVVEEIGAAGGEAMANGANVTDMTQVEGMVRQVMSAWGRVDILVNNAGILRDKTFAKLSLEDFRAVVDVHLMGSVHCARAVWDIMRDQAGGRIIFTTSGSGLYGNFGQSNYAAAKMALVGLMNTLSLEGAKYDIRVNCLAPVAGTSMTEGLFPEADFERLSPGSVSPGLVFLAGPDAPSRTVLAAGGGGFAVYRGIETVGVRLDGADLSAEGIARAWEQIGNSEGVQVFTSGFDQAKRFAAQAAAADKS